MLPSTTNDSCSYQDPQGVWKNIFFTQSNNVLCLLYLTTSHALFDHLQILIMIKHSCLYIWGIQSISHPLTTNNTPMQVNNIPPTQSTLDCIVVRLLPTTTLVIIRRKFSPIKAPTFALLHRTLMVRNTYPIINHLDNTNVIQDPSNFTDQDFV